MLEENGFDPAEDVKEKDKEDEGIADFDKLDYVGYLDLKEDEMLQMVLSFKLLPNDEDVRHQEGYSKGGRICAD